MRLTRRSCSIVVAVKPTLKLFALIAAVCSLAPAADKTFIDYFLPTPIHGHLSADAWGAPNVLPRGWTLILEHMF